MSRLTFLCLISALALLALPAFAQNSPEEIVIGTLREQGYQIVLEERTWLGRARVIAAKGNLRREVVFNPGTGEILRDYAMRMPDSRGDEGVPGTSATISPDQPDVGIALSPEVSLSEPIGVIGIGPTE